MTFSLLLRCARGAEAILAQEAVSCGCTLALSDDGCVVANAPDKHALWRWLLMTRVGERAVLLLGFGAWSTLEQMGTDARHVVAKTDASQYTSACTAWTLRAEHLDTVDVHSQQIAEVMLPVMQTVLPGTYAYKGYKGIVAVFVSTRHWFAGIECLDAELGKRDYRVFIGRDPLRGPTAAAALAILHPEKDSIVVDPVCQSGTIAIEAALLALGKSPRYFERQKLASLLFPALQDGALGFWSALVPASGKPQFTVLAYDHQYPRLRSAEKNAQVAGVKEMITFSRQDMEFFDLKLGKVSVDVLLTCPDVLVAGDEHQFRLNLPVILKKKGRIGILTRFPLRWQAIDKLLLNSNTVLYQGGEQWNLLVFEKG